MCFLDKHGGIGSDVEKESALGTKKAPLPLDNSIGERTVLLRIEFIIPCVLFRKNIYFRIQKYLLSVYANFLQLLKVYI